MEKSLTPSTTTAYQKCYQKCLTFIQNDLNQLPRMPITTEQLHLYIAHLHDAKYKHATIAMHVSAISHFHKMKNLSDPTASYSTAKILTGVKNTQASTVDARLPITKDILGGLIHALQACTLNNREESLYKSMFTTMYYACLRASEVLASSTP